MALKTSLNLSAFKLVPNAPCGVERLFEVLAWTYNDKVPNAPCGVERLFEVLAWTYNDIVPNAPCGVERQNCSFAPMLR